MKKSALAALVLVPLFLAILTAWLFVPPSTNLFNIGKTREQPRIAAADSGVASQQGGLNVTVESSAPSAISPTTRTGSSSKPTVSASRSTEPERLERSASALSYEGQPDDEQTEELTIAGLVQDEDGKPIANIEVLAEAIHPADPDTGSEDASPEVQRSARTSFDGAFNFRNLPDGEYRIRAAPIDGFAPAETTVRTGTLSANLVLSRLWSIRVYGTVNSTEGTPLEDVRILAGPPTRSTYSGPRGDYELEISISGTNSPPKIHFKREGYRDQSVPIAQADLDEMLYDFPLDISMEPLSKLATVTGRLESTAGHPVAGKTVILRSSGLQSSASAKSDNMGYFALKDVEPAKDYRLSVRSGADYRDYEKAQLEIPAGGLQLNIVLEPLGKGAIAGFMTDAEGNPIPRFAMTLYSKVGAGPSVQVVGDQTGFFLVEGFPEGGAVLKTRSYPIFETQGIRVSPETEEPVFVVLDLGPHVLFGQVKTTLGSTMAAEVFLGWKTHENGFRHLSSRKTTADQSGNFVFTGLGSGVHTLRVNAPGFSTAIVEVNIGLDPDNIVVELEEE